MKMVLWTTDCGDDFAEANMAGKPSITTLIDDTTEICGDCNGLVNNLNIGLSIVVEMFLRLRQKHLDTNTGYVLSLIDNNNIEKFSYDAENNTWVEVPPPDVYMEINVTELNRRIAEIENWSGEAYQPNDEVGTAIEAIKNLVKE